MQNEKMTEGERVRQRAVMRDELEKKSCSKNLFGSFILLVDKDRRDNAQASEECDVFMLRQREN